MRAKALGRPAAYWFSWLVVGLFVACIVRAVVYLGDFLQAMAQRVHEETRMLRADNDQVEAVRSRKPGFH